MLGTLGVIGTKGPYMVYREYMVWKQAANTSLGLSTG